MPKTVYIEERRFGHFNTRCRGISKNAVLTSTLIGLTNLYLKRRALMS